MIEIEDLSILDIDKRGGEKEKSVILKLRRTGYIKLHFLARPTGTTLYEKNNFDALCATICKHERRIVQARFTEKGQS